MVFDRYLHLRRRHRCVIEGDPMKKPPSLKSIMTPFPYAVGIAEPLITARKLMLEHHVHHLPVMRDGELAGIISDRDIKLLLGPEFDYPNPRELTVADAFVEDGYAVDINARLGDVLTAMAEHHYGSALVTRKGHLVGILTTTDICRAFGAWLAPEQTPPTAA
jgi:acetoin utilization protein AcuB